MNKYGVLLCSSIFFVLSSLFLYYSAHDRESHFDLDSHGYDRIGKNFAENDSLYDPSRGEVIPVQALGYPLLLGIIYKFFGQHVSYIIILQVLLSLIALYLLTRIAKYLFDDSVASTVAILGSINLGFLIYSQFILTEVFLATLLIAGLERLVYYFKNNSSKALIQSGFWYGLSVVIKPVALFYVPIIFLFIGIFSVQSNKAIIKPIVLFGSFFYLSVAGYMIHNKHHFGVFTIAPVMNENIYFYFLAKLIALDEGISWHDGIKKINTMIGNKDHNNDTRWQKPKNLMHNFMKEKPFFVIRLWFENVFKTFGGLYSSQLKFLINPSLKGTETSFGSKKGSLYNRFYCYITDGIHGTFFKLLAFWQLIFSFLQYIFITITFIVLLREKRYFFVCFVLLSIGYFAFITGHDGCARYRMMFEYFFILFTAFGIVFSYRLLCNDKRGIRYQLRY